MQLEELLLSANADVDAKANSAAELQGAIHSAEATLAETREALNILQEELVGVKSSRESVEKEARNSIFISTFEINYSHSSRPQSRLYLPGRKLSNHYTRKFWTYKRASRHTRNKLVSSKKTMQRPRPLSRKQRQSSEQTFIKCGQT